MAREKLNQVIKFATEQFVGKEKLKKILKSSGYTGPDSWKDELFPEVLAYRIRKTPFILAEAPRYFQVAKYLKNTVFRDDIVIKEVISFGPLVIHESDTDCDETRSFDYCSGLKKETLFPHNKEMSYDEIEEMYKSHKEREIVYQVKIDAETTTGELLKINVAVPMGIVKSNLNLSLLDSGNTTVATRQLNVTMCGDLGSYKTINLEGNSSNITQSIDDRKELLWQCFVKSLLLKKNEYIMMHSSPNLPETRKSLIENNEYKYYQLGVEPGNLILTFELLKKYYELFSKPNPEEIAQDILALVNELRESYPLLVASSEELRDAIINAHLLYEYAIEKKYINAITPVAANSCGALTVYALHKQAQKSSNLGRLPSQLIESSILPFLHQSFFLKGYNSIKSCQERLMHISSQFVRFHGIFQSSSIVKPVATLTYQNDSNRSKLEEKPKGLPKDNPVQVANPQATEVTPSESWVITQQEEVIKQHERSGFCATM